MHETSGLIRQEAAAVAQAEIDVGIALDYAAEDQRRAGHGGLERQSDGVAHIVRLEPVARQDFAMRGDENERPQFVRRRPYRLERVIVEVPAVDVRTDLGAAQSSTRMARLSSSAARCGSCNGRVASATKRSEWRVTTAAISSFCSTAHAAPSAGSTS